MLYGKLKFFKEGTVIKTVDEHVFSGFNAKQLNEYVKNIAGEIGADKCISSCIYHSEAQGTIDTVLFHIP